MLGDKWYTSEKEYKIIDIQDYVLNVIMVMLALAENPRPHIYPCDHRYRRKYMFIIYMIIILFTRLYPLTGPSINR